MKVRIRSKDICREEEKKWWQEVKGLKSLGKYYFLQEGDWNILYNDFLVVDRKKFMCYILGENITYQIIE